MAVTITGPGADLSIANKRTGQEDVRKFRCPIVPSYRVNYGPVGQEIE